jgi:hypothetical protein
LEFIEFGWGLVQVETSEPIGVSGNGAVSQHMLLMVHKLDLV